MTTISWKRWWSDYIPLGELAVIEKQAIDERVRQLCRAMNRLPGIMTSSSWGGHVKRTAVSQEPKGRFYVVFEVTGGRGLKSFELLLLACDYINPEPKISVLNLHRPCALRSAVALFSICWPARLRDSPARLKNGSKRWI
jgi:hypothetical protein